MKKIGMIILKKVKKFIDENEKRPVTSSKNKEDKI